MADEELAAKLQAEEEKAGRPLEAPIAPPRPYKTEQLIPDHPPYMGPTRGLDRGDHNRRGRETDIHRR